MSDSYIGRPFLNVPANTFAKEDFVGSDTGTNSGITNSLVLSREMIRFKWIIKCRSVCKQH